MKFTRVLDEHHKETLRRAYKVIVITQNLIMRVTRIHYKGRKIKSMLDDKFILKSHKLFVTAYKSFLMYKQAM